MSNNCPPALKIGISMTESGPCLDSDWSDSVHDLLLDSTWTEPGQALDNDWILRPVYVQPSIGFQYQFQLKFRTAAGGLTSREATTAFGDDSEI